MLVLAQSISWQNYNDLDSSVPSDRVAGLVIDACENTGDHVRIYETEDLEKSKNALDVVVTDGLGYKILEWKTGWKFVSMKANRIGEIHRVPSK